MDNLLEALARSLNVSVDGISELLSSIKDNTPQLYEQLVREWTYYNVLDMSSRFMLIIMFLLISVLVIVRYNLEVDGDYISSKDIPKGMYKEKYAKILTKENIKNARKTLNMLYVGIVTSILLAIGLTLAKFILAPNYSFLIDEILPRLTHK